MGTILIFETFYTASEFIYFGFLASQYEQPLQKILKLLSVMILYIND